MKRFLVLSGLVLASIVAGVAGAEVALRALDIAYPFPWTLDSERGIALRPGAEGVYREEGEGHFRINGEGMRDRERAVEKPAGTLRIAVLGDSMTEALQVDYEESFPAVLERRLAECPGLAAPEVLNFGVSGYSTAQELLTLRRYVWKYDPDIVLLAFLAQNDVRDNSRALSGYARRPYFRLEDGRLVLDDSFRAGLGFRLRRFLWVNLIDPLIDRSRLLQLANRVRRTLKSQAEAAANPDPGAETLEPERPRRSIPAMNPPAVNPNAAPGKAKDSGAAREAGLSASVYRAPATLKWQAAWEVTERLIRQMRDEVEDHGARFVLAPLPVGAQVNPDPAHRAREARRLGAHDLLYPERRLRRFAGANGIGAVPLVEPLQRLAEKTGVFFHGFPSGEYGAGHINANGHRKIGELLADSLCRDLSAAATTSGTP
jgi:hypothetical protein